MNEKTTKELAALAKQINVNANKNRTNKLKDFKKQQGEHGDEHIGKRSPKCITFDKDAQDNLPQSIKDKMKRNRDDAEKKQALLENLGIDETERKNLYNCKKCGNTITTINRDKGVTPMMLSCSAFNGCSDGMMFSFMYNVPPRLVAGYEWIKEPGEEVLNIKQIKR